MQEERVHSWEELQKALFAGSWRPDLQRFRSTYAFRGLSKAENGLETSLARLGGNYEQMEPHLLRNFRKYASRTAVEDDSIWNWLALAKHHGLPTRLLDWSFSPFVAMHFATYEIDHFQQDSIIWAVDFTMVHREVPQKLHDLLKEEGSDVFTVDMLAASAATLKDFDRLSGSLFTVFFEPPSLDERIVNQYALFSMMSSPDGDLQEWLEERPGVYRKISIPAELKWEIRDKLDQANITERVLFPGLDGLSAWLKRLYKPKSA
jgi:hypothetical protein